jgi:hypothetical protein
MCCLPSLVFKTKFILRNGMRLAKRIQQTLYFLHMPND